MVRHRGVAWYALLAFATVLHYTVQGSPTKPQEVKADKKPWRCYGELGCLSTGGAFYHPLYRPMNFFPEERWVVNTEFLVYTRQNPTQHDYLKWNSTVEQIGRSHFNASQPTKIITHGWLDTVFFGAWLKDMKTAFLLVGDYNVIIVDWRGGNGLPYTQATANTRLVGAEIAAFIKKLQAIFGAKPESFHILGHSLGSHIAGYAGERIPGLGRITGLDPAEPYFQKMPAEVRLDPTDADFVDVVHTDGASFVLDILKGEGLGMYDPVGHVDFYPNGGIKMPGCEFSTRVFKFVTEGLVNGARAIGICHHQRAIDYVIESITDVQCSSLSYACSSYAMFEKGRCSDCGRDGSKCARMGMHADGWKRFKNESRSVRMFIGTNREPPFCAFHYLVNLEMFNNPDASEASGDLILKLQGTRDECEMKVNSGTDTLYPKATYSFVTKTPVHVGNIKKAFITYKSNSFLSVFSPRMQLWKVKIMPMNRPTKRQERTDRTMVFCSTALGGLTSGRLTSLSPC
ncbi:pancreatic lipase-related protein 2-like [Rhipicephalus sanguineus]|uniref:pancreatic lipase-related protein 2-like n=1 Tax=Rhipicephalus sanguineus TaxID=34632 RepID=UPI0020C51A08|nr:pancreatic lipase-related protein 2-like [Rhipicephalus sanguineus]